MRTFLPFAIGAVTVRRIVQCFAILLVGHAACAFAQGGASLMEPHSTRRDAQRAVPAGAHAAGPGFVENRGQVRDNNGARRPELLYTMNSGGLAVYLAPGSIHYVYARPAGDGGLRRIPRVGCPHDAVPDREVELWRLDLEFLGASPSVRVTPADTFAGVANYYLGDDGPGIAGARLFGGVRYHGMYPGIDLVVRVMPGGLKYDFVVHPGGSPASIRMRYVGAQSVTLGRGGDLRVGTGLGSLQDAAPILFQESPAGAARRRISVDGRFARHGDTIMFDVARYDSTRDLVIDPAQEWATFYGGGGPTFFDMDYFSGGHVAEIDRQGNPIIIGNTLSATFPTTPGALRANLQGVVDAFVAKFDPHGNILFATYYGGTNGDDYGHGVCSDPSGNVIITGHTSSTDIPRANAYQNTFAGGVLDAYVAKLGPTGALLWGTYCGSVAWDDCYGAAVDSAGNVYAVLTTTGAVLAGAAVPSKGARNPAHPTGGAPVNNDVMIVKFNGATGQPVWTKFLGGGNMEYGFAAASDSRNNISVTGWTTSNDFGTTAGCAQPANGGGSDAFVVRIDSSGATTWATYYGGAGTENNGLFPLPIIGDFGVSGLAVDDAGNVVITGATSGAFPTTATAWQRNPLGGTDAFAVKFDSGGAVRWATYIGTGGADYGMGIACTGQGSVVIAGATTAAGLAVNGPGQDPTFQAAYGGGANDGFIVKLSRDGAAQWATYFGGNGDDACHGVACDPRGGFVVTGETTSLGAPFMLRSRHQVANNQALARPGNAGGYDGFLSYFCETEPPRVDSSGSHALCAGDTLRLWIAPGNSSVKWYRRDPPAYATSTELVAFRDRDTLRLADSGRYYVVVESPAGCTAQGNDVVVLRSGRVVPVIAPAEPITICLGDTVELRATNGPFAQYRWRRAAGVYETTPTMKVWAGGAYSLQVTNAFGCRDSASVVVQESPKPAPVIVSGDTAICADAQATLNAAGGAGGTVRWYSTSGPAVLATGAQLLTNRPGTYYAVSVSAEACSTRSNAFTLRVFASPRPKVQGLLPTIFCDGDSTILEAIPAAAGDAVFAGSTYRRYQWSTGDTVRRIVVRNVPVGQTSIAVQVTDTNNCTAQATITITKNPRPKPTVAVTPDTVVCEGDSVTLTAGGAFAGFLWNNGSTDARITVMRGAAYVLTATTNDGCVALSDTVHITVLPRPSATIAGPVAVCVNSVQQYSVAALPGLVYAWRVEGPSGTIASGAAAGTVNVNWGAAGANRVIVVVTNTASGCSAADTLAVAVGSVLRPNIATNRSPRLCPGDTVILDAGAGFVRYAWSTGDTTRTLAVTEPGAYSVTVANAGGCSGSSAPLIVSLVDAVVPTITPSRATALCPGDTVELDAGAGFAAYRWSNGAVGRRVRAWAAGDYSVATVDSNGCRANSATVRITMNVPPQPAVVGPNSVCVGSVAGYSAAAAAGDLYAWSVRGNGAVITAGQGTATVAVQFGGVGDDTVEVAITSATTGCTGRAVYPVTVGTTLAPVIVPDRPAATICSGDSVRLSVPGGYSRYRWSPGNDSTPSIVVRTAGLYRVSVADSSGCAGIGEITVSVRPPVSVAVSAPDGTGFCPGDTIRLVAPPGFARYRWMPGGDTTQQIRVAAAGMYSVAVIDADGCGGDSPPVAVVALRAPVVFAIDTTGGVLAVAPDTVAGPPIAGYQWLKDGAAISGATGSGIVPGGPGVYTVTVTSIDGCSSAASPVRLDVPASAVIGLPTISAAPGERVVVPIQLADSRGLDAVGARRFEAEIRFNGTMLVPVDVVGNVVPTVALPGDERSITVAGQRTTNTTQGELARVLFVAALGGDTVTPLRLVNFRWIDAGNVPVTAQDGEFRLSGLCYQGGARLLGTGQAAKIVAIQPNPTTGATSVAYDVLERGETRLVLVNQLGQTVSTLAAGLMTPGRYVAAWDARSLPAGVYHCVLTTPSTCAVCRVAVVR